jgi:large subunit ribosomal protein L13
MERQTYFAKPGEVSRDWHLVDATDRSLGRMATEIATVLMGKHKPTYTPHVDTGDFVVVINAAKVQLTGRKADQKYIETYSGYPGGRRVRTYREMRAHHPERLVELAVRRMLPKSDLGQNLIKKLKVYAGAEHPHAAQQPQPLNV